ncbi:hypothetical protein OHS18_43045 [Amycolatopsis sp. NBC_00355]|uniref:hypothetical protein n=1 Tax=Amycolatopsis sp. NBC_00355 TaxID=2975957 RepID=UPI002E2578B5
MSDRAGRRVPPLIPGLSLGLGFVVLPAGHAPAALVSPAASMLVSLPVTDVITVGAKVKISRYSAVAPPPSCADADLRRVGACCRPCPSPGWRGRGSPCATTPRRRCSPSR